MAPTLYHIGDLVVFTYKDMVEQVGVIEFIDEDFYGDIIYSVICSDKTLFLRQPYILRLAYN
jgi:hypothetical protein